MANPEHLAILKQGVGEWNNWRKENPGVRPDLEKADLSGVDLAWVDKVGSSRRGADLSEAKFSEANLSKALLNGANFAGTDLRWAHLKEANLIDAILVGADLAGADLSGANLTSAWLTGAILHQANFSGSKLNGARLYGADFTGASLWGADLTKANLFRANFASVILVKADFTGAEIGYTSFIDVDLSNAIGLETVVHIRPSSIGIDTVYRSKGRISERFLQHAGVPDDFIPYIPSLVNNPIEYYSLFISYSSKDQEFAERLHADLQAQGVRCWFTPHDMKIGDDILDRIDESIRVRDKLLLILSSNSIFSPWVEKEVETAFEEEQPTRKGKTILFPIRLDDEVMTTNKAWAADIRRTRHIGDFTNWKNHDAYQAAFQRLLRDLKASAQG